MIGCAEVKARTPSEVCMAASGSGAGCAAHCSMPCSHWTYCDNGSRMHRASFGLFLTPAATVAVQRTALGQLSSLGAMTLVFE